MAYTVYTWKKTIDHIATPQSMGKLADEIRAAIVPQPVNVWYDLETDYVHAAYDPALINDPYVGSDKEAVDDAISAHDGLPYPAVVERAVGSTTETDDSATYVDVPGMELKLNPGEHDITFNAQHNAGDVRCVIEVDGSTLPLTNRRREGDTAGSGPFMIEDRITVTKMGTSVKILWKLIAGVSMEFKRRVLKSVEIF